MSRPKDLGIKARIEAAVSISSGVGVTLLGGAVLFTSFKEAIMNSSDALAVLIWCGVALLRSQVG